MRALGRRHIQVLVGATAVIMLLAMVLVILEGNRITAGMMTTNQKQLRQLHQASSIASEEFGWLRPGLVHRLPDPELGVRIPGRGPEDVTRNTTGYLYATLISQNYIGPQLLISPFERNAWVNSNVPWVDLNVTAAPGFTWWGTPLPMDLTAGAAASYGHAPFSDEADSREFWDLSLGPGTVCQFGNRGPANGIASTASLSCQADGRWLGHFVFSGGHVEPVNAKKGESVRVPGMAVYDNPFADDPGQGDAFIAITASVDENGVATYQHD